MKRRKRRRRMREEKEEEERFKLKLQWAKEQEDDSQERTLVYSRIKNKFVIERQCINKNINIEQIPSNTPTEYVWRENQPYKPR